MATAAARSARALAAAAALAACAGGAPPGPGPHADALAPCPASPNCVSSDARDALHHVEAFALAQEPPEAWRAARETVASLPRTRIVVATDAYLRAECRSALFGFVDDLELALRADAHTIAVRSASRVGWSDLGANRRRVEALRAELAARGVLR